MVFERVLIFLTSNNFKIISKKSFLFELRYTLNRMKKYFLFIIFISFFIKAWSLDTLSVCSPSGKICVKIWMEKYEPVKQYNTVNSGNRVRKELINFNR